jgi:hypothetical protein
MAARNLTKTRRKPPARSKPPFALEGIDHILLLVKGMKPAVRFYTDVLGCKIEGKLPQYGMLQLRAGSALIDLVDVSVPQAAWAVPPVAGGRISIISAWRSAHTTKRSCVGIWRGITSRSSRRVSMVAAAARAYRSTSATPPAT